MDQLKSIQQEEKERCQNEEDQDTFDSNQQNQSQDKRQTQENNVLKSRQQLKKEAIKKANEYLKKLGLKFCWDNYEKQFEGKDFKGAHYGKFPDRIRFGDRYYYGYFFEKKSLQDPSLSKCDIDNPNSNFDDELYKIAVEFYQFIEDTKIKISNMK